MVSCRFSLKPIHWDSWWLKSLLKKTPENHHESWSVNSVDLLRKRWKTWSCRRNPWVLGYERIVFFSEPIGPLGKFAWCFWPTLGNSTESGWKYSVVVVICYPTVINGSNGMIIPIDMAGFFFLRPVAVIGGAVEVTYFRVYTVYSWWNHLHKLGYNPSNYGETYPVGSLEPSK